MGSKFGSLLIAFLCSGTLFSQVLIDNFYFGPNAIQSPEMVMDVNNDLYFAYVNIDSIPSKLILHKTGLCGNLIWSRNLNFNQPINRLVGLRYDGENLIIAAVAGGAFPDSSLIVTKLNGEGQAIWRRQFLRANNDVFWYNIDVNQAGEIYLNANANQGASNLSVITKLSPAGNIVWSNGYQTAAIWGMGAATRDGGFIRAVGRSLYKVSAQGQMLWFNWLNNSLYQSQTPPLEVNDGYLIFTNAQSGNSCQVIKIDKNGNKLWESKKINGFTISSAALLESGQFAIGADGYNAQSRSELRFVVFNSQGQVIEEQKRVSHNNNRFFNTLAYRNGKLRSLSNVLVNNQPGLGLLTLPTTKWMEGDCATEKADFNQLSAVTTSTQNSTFLGQGFSFQISTPPFSTTNLNFNQDAQCNKVSLKELPRLANDTSLCENNEITLKAIPALEGTFIWNNGETGAEITVNQAGSYYFTYTPYCSDTSFSDTINISLLSAPDFEVIYDRDQKLLPGQTLSLQTLSNQDLNYSWLLPDGQSVPGPTLDYIVQNVGTDSLQVSAIDSNACTSHTSIILETGIPELFIANAFTPNNDGLNDTFGPPEKTVFEYTLMVQDRYGKKLAILTNQAWDGRYKGEDLPAGVYTYQLQFRFYPTDTERFHDGFVHLLR